MSSQTVNEDWWPCDRREAHGSHPTPCNCIGVPRRDCTGRLCAHEQECPGVSAHPDVMIGRQR